MRGTGAESSEKRELKRREAALPSLHQTESADAASEKDCRATAVLRTQKCLRHGERLQPLPDVNPARGGRGHAWLRRSSRRRGKSGGEEAYVPTFQCSKSVIAISDFFVNCFFENSFHRPFLLSSSFKNASNAAFFPILQCRNASCAGKAALLPPGKSDWKKCGYRVILVY